jgi:uncharacterized protein
MDLTQDKYKLSQYNVFHREGDVQYMWNTYSNALLKLDKKSQEYVQSFNNSPLADDGSNEFSILKDNGFVVFESIDEFGRIKLQQRQTLLAHDSRVSFIIAPGMGCNYKCRYCFEKDSDQTGVMTLEVADDVAEYICNTLKNNPHIKQIDISWFGGEPLLYFDSIEVISRKVIEYTDENNIVFSAGIITNGRFMDEEILMKMQECRITGAQITLDGTCDVYCESKGATIEDFDCVIKNIIYASDKIYISIRLNIPDYDVKEAIAITDLLLTEYELLDKISVYFAFIKNYTLGVDTKQQAFVKFSKNYLSWTDYVVKNYGISKINLAIPSQRLTHCGIIKMCNACIGPRGELYRCEHDFGDSTKITGDIWHGRFFNDAEFQYYDTIDTIKEGKCSECNYLPICMGGCMREHIDGYLGIDCDASNEIHFKLKLLKATNDTELLTKSADVCNEYCGNHSCPFARLDCSTYQCGHFHVLREGW